MLGLQRADADRPDWRAVLKRAYRALALLFHPDKNPRDPDAAAARFLEISEAYKTLSDDEARARYDGTGVAGVQPETEGGAEGGARWGAERPTHAPDDGSAGRRREGPPSGAPEDWKFQFDKRDVDADGFARGRWVHKETGESADGTRDVSPARRKNPCVRRHACVDGAGGHLGGDAARPNQGRADRGGDGRVEPAKLRASEARGEPPAAGFQTLEIGFTLAHELNHGGRRGRDVDVAGSRRRRPPRRRTTLGDPRTSADAARRRPASAARPRTAPRARLRRRRRAHPGRGYPIFEGRRGW